MRRLLIIAVVVLLIVGVSAAVVTWQAATWLDRPLALTQAVTIEIPRGAPLRAIAADLERQGIIDQPRIWVYWARFTGRANGLKAGEYALEPGLTPSTLLELLSSGQVVLHSITFIEGSTFAEFRRALAANDAVKASLGDKSDAEVMRALGAAELHPEGQFFPDTYRFARGTTDLELLSYARLRMRTELEVAWKSRAADLPLATPYEALILASIVEKETALDRERPLIAGVFVERLRRGMRLQTDPTVIYGMGQSYNGNIRREDLRRDTPYNTYTRAGLPPTPIAMPGTAALRAAVQPNRSGAIFFVATGAGDGSHYFSSTLAEHEAAVKRLLRRQRQQRTGQQ